MKKAALFLSKGFEEIETITPWDILRRAGITVIGVSTDNTPHVRGGQRIFVEPDIFLKELIVDDFEMLIVPGGSLGTKTLKENNEALKVIKEFYDKGKYVASICAGPTVLGAAGILNGVKVTSYPGLEEELKSYGAIYVGGNVVVDGKIITSRGVGTALEFAIKLAEICAGAETAEKVAKAVLFK